MRLWKVWIESVRHLADFGREPGCHFTPGCIGNRTHCPFLFKERWWVLFYQSLNPSFRSRSRLKFVDDRLSEDLMVSQFLREYRANCWKTWWCWNEFVRIWCEERCVILKFGHECFVMIFWCNCSWCELGSWNGGCKVSSSTWFRLPPLWLYSLTLLETLLYFTLLYILTSLISRMWRPKSTCHVVNIHVILREL